MDDSQLLNRGGARDIRRSAVAKQEAPTGGKEDCLGQYHGIGRLLEPGALWLHGSNHPNGSGVWALLRA